MINETDSRLIDKYLQEGLTESEKSQFHSLMEIPAFAEEVAFREKLSLASQEEGRSELKKLFEELDEELDEEEDSPVISMRNSRKNWYRWSGIAAVILVLIAFFLRPTSASNQELFAAHYDVFENLIAPNVRNNPDLDSLGQALQAYERKDFAEAVNLFEDLELNQESRIYYGLSLLMGEGNDEKAIIELKTVAEDNEARYQQAAQWYLCLAYLKVDDRQSAINEVDEILSNNEHSYGKLASKLKQDL